MSNKGENTWGSHNDYLNFDIGLDGIFTIIANRIPCIFLPEIYSEY